MIIVRIKAAAHAKKESIEQIAPQTLRITVREPAENNRANKRILELLAEYYELPVKKFRIISGHTAPNKMIQILN
jgi:uncharacterized protein YggU (UPF0235/DUF167 family)